MKHINLISFIPLITIPIILSGCALFEIPDDPYWDDVSGERKASEREYQVEQPSYSDVRRENRRPSSKDIMIGMPMREVLSQWGEPSEVETAGKVDRGNQKWIYTDGVFSRYGMNKSRVLYFEQGRVAGWDTNFTEYPSTR